MGKQTTHAFLESALSVAICMWIGLSIGAMFQANIVGVVIGLAFCVLITLITMGLKFAELREEITAENSQLNERIKKLEKKAGNVQA